ncbi:M20 family metallo-hydrolase [Pseudoroseomonas globiformis]|uniref:M20 family metallo-hydrolase n=1 Tax=Teichococcus globiformis TaxID=2307229 RepID=A0ABV7FZH5_9PROT
MTEPFASRMIKVNQARHWARLMEMAEIGAIPGPTDADRGVNRACLTRLDREARRLLIGWARDIGLSVSVDSMANLFLRLEGQDTEAEPVLTGSHMDTQPRGGRFDGIWGVLAGLEAVQAIREGSIWPRRPIEIVAWTNEEGGRFAPGCMGSMAWSGSEPANRWDAVIDSDGVSFRAALEQHLAEEADLPRRPLGPVGKAKPVAYIEAHIEQGPILEAEQLDIGIVTGIQGSRWFNVEIRGKTDHAGTTPLGLRHDAVQDMIRAINALNTLTHDPEDILRFTVGRIEVLPGSSNTVADTARFTIDLRHPDAAILLSKGDAIPQTVEAALQDCSASVSETFNAAPRQFQHDVLDAIARAAQLNEARYRHLMSGAFHDAQFLASVCPTGMIFAPSRAGISHHPAEYSSPEQLARGTQVLASTLLDLASR